MFIFFSRFDKGKLECLQNYIFCYFKFYLFAVIQLKIIVEILHYFQKTLILAVWLAFT